MENSQQQILSEIQSLMASVRSQLEELDAKISQWQQSVEPDTVSVIDLELEDDVHLDFPDQPSQQSAEEVELPATEPVMQESVVEEVELPSTEPVVQEFVADEIELPSAEPAVQDSVVDEVELLLEDPVEESAAAESIIDDDLPFFDVPETVSRPVPKAMIDQPSEKAAVIDTMTQKHAWRTAIPGTPVKDVRGAIALMDRVLFINALFGTDPMAFQDALTRINQMQTLDEAVNYLAVEHPEWDFDSEIVYSFMMAVRRKVN